MMHASDNAPLVSTEPEKKETTKNAPSPLGDITNHDLHQRVPHMASPPACDVATAIPTSAKRVQLALHRKDSNIVTTPRICKGFRIIGGTPDTVPESDDRSALLSDYCDRGALPAAEEVIARRRLRETLDILDSPHGQGHGHRHQCSHGVKGGAQWPRLLRMTTVVLLVGASLFFAGYQRGRSHELDRESTATGGAGDNSLLRMENDDAVFAAARDGIESNQGEDEDATAAAKVASGDNGEIRRAFVCITGQLPRLELNNKIRNMLRPFRDDYGLTVDVALVLSDSDHASNHHTQDREAQEYYSVSEVVDALTPYANDILHAELDVQAPRPVVPEIYFNQLGKKDLMTRDEQRERVRNHLRQFESISKCHRWMVRTGREYEVVHRIRDDTGYYAPVNYTTVSTLLSKSPVSIASSVCAKHGGINDRGSFVTPLAAYDYFNHPIMQIYTQPIGPDIDNTEKFLKKTYEKTVDNMAVMEDLFLLKFIAPPGGEEEKTGKKKKGLKGEKEKEGEEEETESLAKGFYHKSDRDCINKHGLNPRGL